jgi:ribosomal protein S18 acetylase RimI-like enzyme
MSAAVEYLCNKASVPQIAEHLLHCDVDFIPPLSGRVEINDYAQKIAGKATRIEAWLGGTLVGLVAVYCNDQEDHIAYITSVSVLPAWTGNGIATRLINQCVEHAKASGMRRISLEVSGDNARAIKLYEKSGFVAGKAIAPFVTMSLFL